MVNEERLRHLIKMAQFDTNDGKQCKPMTQYARKDYVSMRLLGSFVTGTICYGLLMGMWGLYATEELLAKLKSYSEEMKNDVVKKADKLASIGYKEYLSQMK